MLHIRPTSMKEMHRTNIIMVHGAMKAFIGLFQNLTYIKAITLVTDDFHIVFWDKQTSASVKSGSLELKAAIYYILLILKYGSFAKYIFF